MDWEETKLLADASMLASLGIFVLSYVGYLGLTVLFLRRGEMAAGILCAVCAALCPPAGVLLALPIAWINARRWQLRAFIALWSGLVVVCALFLAGAGFLGWRADVLQERQSEVNRERYEYYETRSKIRYAIAQVEKLGGSVKFDQSMPGGPVVEVSLFIEQAPDELSFLRAFPHLRVLYVNLMDAPLADSALAEIAKLDSLQELYLMQVKISEFGMVHLGNLKKLRALGLSACTVSDSGVASIKGLTELEELSLTNTEITDAGMVYLSDMRKLRELFLVNTKIGDSGLAHLAQLTELRSLNLESTRVTDSGLAHLSTLMRLRDVDLGNTPITDAGLQHLGGLVELRTLKVTNTNMTGSGLSHLTRCTELRHLHLSETRVDDAALQRLRSFSQLEDLYLDQTQVTDAGLPHLQSLTALRSLHLYGTKVTDRGLRQLEGLRQLRELSLSETQEGIKALKKALPELRVNHYDP